MTSSSIPPLLLLGVPGASAGQTHAQTTAPDRFKQRDKNSDDKLTRDELPAALFDRLDANEDGFVTETELAALWKRN